jgi:hypothetical protein
MQQLLCKYHAQTVSVRVHHFSAVTHIEVARTVLVHGAGGGGGGEKQSVREESECVSERASMRAREFIRN